MHDILSGKMASNPRNKQIASIFKEAGIIEKYGSGIKRVRQVLANAGAAEPIFEIIAGYFKVTLFPIAAKPSGGVSGGVSDLLNFITENPGKNSEEIKKALNLPQRSLERWLKQLKDNDKIEFRGVPKTGGYYLLASKQK
jgi:ATP-dependent DNA helicase RecG